MARTRTGFPWGRTSYAFTEQFKLVGEQVDATDGTRKLTKFTIAPTWSPAGPRFWARPEIRLTTPTPPGTKAAQQAASLPDAGSALSDSGAFDTARHGYNFGVQVEHWW